MRVLETRLSKLIANTLYQFHKEGMSLNRDLDKPKSGYMVSMFQGPIYDNSLSVNVSEVQAWIKKTNLFKDYFFGVWTDAETGKIYFDASVNDNNKEAAIECGKELKQIAIWDVVNCCEIRL